MSAEENPIDSDPEAIDLEAAKEAMDAMQNPEVQALLAEIRSRGPLTNDPPDNAAATNTALAILASNLVQNSNRSSNATIVQLAEKQKNLSVSTSGPSKGTLAPDEVHKFATVLASNASKKGSSYSREDHLTFISQDAQAIIIGLMLDKQDDVDLFGLPSAELAEQLKSLFPKISENISVLEKVRGFKDQIPANWWKHAAHLQPFITALVNRLDFLQSGRWKDKNGNLFSDAEWPKIYEAFLECFIADRNETKANLESEEWNTHRQFVDAIAEYPPDNLNELLRAFLAVGKDYSDDYNKAVRRGWIRKQPANQQPSASRPQAQVQGKSGGGGAVSTKQSTTALYVNPNWPPCSKCSTVHNHKAPCPVKPTTSGSSASSSSSSSSVSNNPNNSTKAGDKRPSAGGGRWKDKKSKGGDLTHEVTHNIYNIPYNSVVKHVSIPNRDNLGYENVAPKTESVMTMSDCHPRHLLTDKVNINFTPSDSELINNILTNTSPSTTVPMVLVSKFPSIENILIDSGSLKSNYIDYKLFDRLKAQGMPTRPLSNKRRVCSGLAGVEGQTINECIELLLVYIDEVNNKEKSLIITLLPVQLRDQSSFKIIIGLPIIQMHRLASCFPSVFEGTKYNHHKFFSPLSKFISDENFSLNQGRSSLTSAKVGSLDSDIEEPILHIDHMSDLQGRAITSGSTDSAPIEGPVIINTLDSHDSDESPQEELYSRFERAARDNPNVESSDEVMSLESLLAYSQLYGPPTLQRKLTKLLDKFRHIFALTVSTTPAVVDEPMKIIINKEQWEHKSNRQPPIMQTQLKEEELRKQVVGLLEAGVIRRSKAQYWSQVHLAPKPDEKWRFCIDYRKLNSTTYPTEGHPLPRIDHMLQRLGRRKAKYFGVIDLTAGYHQVPLAPEAIPLTAFICFMGIFEFLRVPFGLTNACSYFQHFIAVVVLAELMYIICEAYVDDVIVSGQEEDDFVSNVEAVFTKFDLHHIKVNPKKMKLGLTQVECVGHVVDKDGVHFSRSKLDSVLNFKRPEYAAQMG